METVEEISDRQVSWPWVARRRWLAVARQPRIVSGGPSSFETPTPRLLDVLFLLVPIGPSLPVGPVQMVDLPSDPLPPTGLEGLESAVPPGEWTCRVLVTVTEAKFVGEWLCWMWRRRSWLTVVPAPLLSLPGDPPSREVLPWPVTGAVPASTTASGFSWVIGVVGRLAVVLVVRRSGGPPGFACALSARCLASDVPRALVVSHSLGAARWRPLGTWMRPSSTLTVLAARRLMPSHPAAVWELPFGRSTLGHLRRRMARSAPGGPPPQLARSLTPWSLARRPPPHRRSPRRHRPACAWPAARRAWSPA